MVKLQILKVKTQEFQAKMVKNRNLFCDFPYRFPLDWFVGVLVRRKFCAFFQKIQDGGWN
jgi:hypothetical protein